MNVNGTNGNVQSTISAPGNTVTEGTISVFTASSTTGQIAYVHYSLTLYWRQSNGGAMFFAVAPPGGFGGTTLTNNSSVTSASAGAPNGGGASGLVPTNGYCFLSLTGKTVLGPGATFEIPYFFDNLDATITNTVNYNAEYDVTYQS
jgi:hypothetical protein